MRAARHELSFVKYHHSQVIFTSFRAGLDVGQDWSWRTPRSQSANGLGSRRLRTDALGFLHPHRGRQNKVWDAWVPAGCARAPASKRCCKSRRRRWRLR